VRHPTFGEGVIVSIKASGTDQQLTVVFLQHGVKKLLASYAKLEVIGRRST
jgi:hypothetical protein